MYQRNSRAATWQPEGKPALASNPADQVQEASQGRIIWAKVPYPSSKGRCVAVSLRGEVLWVGVAASPTVQWLPARQVLSDGEAARWAKSGF